MAFSAKTLDFLFENRLQDSRDWFLDHKDTYQAVLLEPMKDLVRSLTPVMLEIDAKVTTEPRVTRRFAGCAGIPGTAMTNHFTGIPCGSYSSVEKCTVLRCREFILRLPATDLIMGAASITLRRRI